MSFNSSLLTKDSIWEVFDRAQDLESFRKYYARPIFLKDEVPEVVKEETKLVEKLLLHSYFEYQFIDLALTHSIFTLEKALRIRYSELVTESKKVNFITLIDWFLNNQYFETTNPDALHQLRQIRNGKVHNESNSLGGIAFLRKVYSVFYLINDLYEDVALRKDRNNERIRIQNIIKKLTEHGGLVCIAGNKHIIHKADVVFYNNKSCVNTLYISIWPLYRIRDIEEGFIQMPPSIHIELKDWQIVDNCIIGNIVDNNEKFTLSNIEDQNDLELFRDWRSNLLDQRNFVLLDFLTHDNSTLFYKALHKFHSTVC